MSPQQPMQQTNSEVGAKDGPPPPFAPNASPTEAASSAPPPASAPPEPTNPNFQPAPGTEYAYPPPPAGYPPQSQPPGYVQYPPPPMYPPPQQQGYPPQQQGYPPQQQGYPPQQGYPQQGYPQQGYPIAQYDERGQPLNYAQPGVQIVHHGAPSPTQVIVVHQHTHHKDKKDEWAPIIIFIVGWFFCPVWCAGWYYVTKKHNQTSRIFGLLSGICAFLNSLWIVIVIAVTVSAASSVANSVNYAYSPTYYNYSYYYNGAALGTR